MELIRCAFAVPGPSADLGLRTFRKPQYLSDNESCGEASERQLQSAHASIQSFLTSFTTSRDDGALIGPFNNLLRFPVLGKAAWQLFLAINSHRKLPSFAHEIAILVTGAHFGSMYELYSHESVAAATKALSPAKIATIAAGQRPCGLSDEEAIAYDTVAVLNHGSQVPKSTYDRAVKAFGEDGVAELVYLVGCYSTICLLLNAFDVSLPGTEMGYESSDGKPERKLPGFRKNLEELKELKPSGGSGSSGGRASSKSQLWATRTKQDRTNPRANP